MEANDNCYRFHGNEGECVPRDVRELTFNPIIQVLMDDLCRNCRLLQEATLPNGLIKIGKDSFTIAKACWKSRFVAVRNLLGRVRLQAAKTWQKFDFEFSSPSPHRLSLIAIHCKESKSPRLWTYLARVLLRAARPWRKSIYLQQPSRLFQCCVLWMSLTQLIGVPVYWWLCI